MDIDWDLLVHQKSTVCFLCNKKFSSTRVMKRHVEEVHTLERNYPCDECGKMFVSAIRVGIHKRNVHMGFKPESQTHYVCHYCNAIYTNKVMLRDHICAHIGVKLHQCDTCYNYYSSAKCLKRHKLIHSKIVKSKSFVVPDIENLSADQYKDLVKSKVKFCPVCCKEFSTARYMRKHLREIHSTEKNNWCDQCGNQYKSKSSLTEHKKYMHSSKHLERKEKKFECTICGAMQATKYTLRDHMNTHTGNKYTCEICGNSYASVKHLRRHKLKHRKEEGTLPDYMIYKCDVCLREFTQNHMLKKHKEWVHGDKYHLCKVCGAKIKGSLRQHMVTHTGEKKYCCHICGKKLRGKLKEHMLTHTGERPFACEVCGSTFKDKWYLRIHMRKHNGERPYMCSECGQSFAARSAFTLHLRKHNAPVPIACNYCQVTFTSKPLLKEHIVKCHLV